MPLYLGDHVRIGWLLGAYGALRHLEEARSGPFKANNIDNIENCVHMFVRPNEISHRSQQQNW